MGQIIIFLLFSWIIWKIYSELFDEINTPNKPPFDTKKSQFRLNAQAIRYIGQKASLPKGKASQRVPRGDCVCGCNGVPLTRVPEYSIDYKLYTNCPARWRRKRTGKYINDDGIECIWARPLQEMRRLTTEEIEERRKLFDSENCSRRCKAN